MTHPIRQFRPPSSPVSIIVSPRASPRAALEMGANAGAGSGAASTAAQVLPSSYPPPRPQPRPQPSYPPPPTISISPPSTPGSPLHSPIDIADASFERFHATRSPNPTTSVISNDKASPPGSDRRASLYDGNEKSTRGSVESDLDLDLELDFELDYIDDDDSDILHNMAGYVGQSRIRGGSETMQMVLLTFVMIGITCVFPPPFDHRGRYRYS